MKGLGIVVVLYLLACLALRQYQTRLIFFPEASLKGTPAEVGMQYEDVWLESSEGKVHGWWMPAAKVDAPALLYLHGNGSNIGDLAGRALQLQQLGVGVLLIDYRGYGKSSGPFPNEQRVYEDAEAGWQYLTEDRGIERKDVLIYGRSIGGAIALNLATNHADAAGAIIEASFTSMRDMVSLKYPVLPMPVDWLLTQKFESKKKVRSLNMPLLFFHGTADSVVPTDMSQQLYDAASSSESSKKELVFIEGAGHNDVPWTGGKAYEQPLAEFIEELMTQ